jgi:DNA-binding Xre family transcriptional regulator
MNNFDKTLRRKRVKLQTLSKATGLNLTYLTNLRAGRKDNVTLRVAFKISQFLGVSVEELFGDMINISKIRKLPTGADGLTFEQRIALKKQQRDADNKESVRDDAGSGDSV